MYIIGHYYIDYKCPSYFSVCLFPRLVMPPTPMKRDSPSGHGEPVCPSSHPTLVSPEPEQGAPVRTQKPVPAPRSRPAHYAIPVRSASDGKTGLWLSLRRYTVVLLPHEDGSSAFKTVNVFL